MDTLTVTIDGGLSDNVRETKDPLARQIRTLIKERVIGAGGILKKFEVYGGVIFADVDKSDASDAIIKQFSSITGAVAQVVDPLQAIYRKAQLRPAAKVETKAA